MRGALWNRPVGSRCSGQIYPRVRGALGLPTIPMRCDPIYPRVCGALDDQPTRDRPRQTIYPRVCGALGIRWDMPGSPIRSIPACAGSAWEGRAFLMEVWIYPRVCGALYVGTNQTVILLDLSPRVRGSAVGIRRPFSRSRSIPACAGLCGSRWRLSRYGSIYPRVCGALGDGQSSRRGGFDLSPRVRGSADVARTWKTYRRSIPACAGLCRNVAALPPLEAIYPRVCGALSGAGRPRPRASIYPRVCGALRCPTRRR